MPIDMKSIMSKAQACVNSSKGRAKIRDTVDKAMLGDICLQSGATVHTPQEAAEKFIEVLKRNIESAGLSADAQAAISNLAFTSPKKLADGTYSIGIYFSDDLSRPSLDEARYGRISDLAELFNNGVSHTMRPVHGTWHGHETWSRTTIPGTHFMEQAKEEFLASYANEYNVSYVFLNKSW